MRPLSFATHNRISAPRFVADQAVPSLGRAFSSSSAPIYRDWLSVSFSDYPQGWAVRPWGGWRDVCAALPKLGEDMDNRRKVSHESGGSRRAAACASSDGTLRFTQVTGRIAHDARRRTRE